MSLEVFSSNRLPSAGPTTIEEHITVSRFDPEVTGLFDESNYTILWMKDGFRSLTIDHDRFTVQPHSIYFIARGKKIAVEIASEPHGWILKFSRELFSEHVSENLIIKDVDIFASFGEVPKIVLSPKIGDRISIITEMIDELIGSQIPNRESAIASLLKTLLIYCDSRCNIRITEDNNTAQVQIVTTFKQLVSEHFMELHKVSDYAKLMNISSKYLNQMVKNVLGVTAKSIIQEQLIIKARRELKFSNESVKEIAFKLGFSEPFHFSNYFKKQVGCSPSQYRLL